MQLPEVYMALMSRAAKPLNITSTSKCQAFISFHILLFQGTTRSSLCPILFSKQVPPAIELMLHLQVTRHPHLVPLLDKTMVASQVT